VVILGVEFAREHCSPWTMRCCTGDAWLGGGGEDDERLLFNSHFSGGVLLVLGMETWLWRLQPRRQREPRKMRRQRRQRQMNHGLQQQIV
jgi:hypothetical protein